MEEAKKGEECPRLTTLERAGVLGIALLVFAFGAGPVWRHAWSPDAPILWSYAVIPALVIVLLGRRRVLRPAPFLAESLVLSVFKFGITAMVLIGFWSFSNPPHARPSERASATDRRWKIFSKGEHGGGDARSDPPAPSAIVRIGNGRIDPAAISLVSSSAIAFRSSDGLLHALELLAPDGSVRANVPLLASGLPRTLSFEEISRAASLRCAIHPEETATISR